VTTDRARSALITGITGQDGLLLAENLLGKNYRVVGFGRRSSILTRPELKPLLPRIAVAFGDLYDAVSIADAVQRYQPDEL